VEHGTLNFVIAGAQKCGTSSLDALLRAHARLQMARVKETHFFDNEQRRWDRPDYRDLDAYFTAADGRLRGEATPITLYWRPAIRRLRDYNPDIRLIVLLRDPVERAYSNWRKEFTLGRERLPFGEAIRDGRARVRRNHEIEGLHRHFSYVERGFYGAQLAYLSNFFAPSQIHVEIAEEFFRHQAPTLGRVSDFLGIDAFPHDLPVVHRNPGRPLANSISLSKEDGDLLYALYADDIAAVETWMGGPISAWRR
jgi:hypothetical protein